MTGKTQTARIAIVTDIHADRQHGSKQGDRALALLEDFVERINTSEGRDCPNLVLEFIARALLICPKPEQS